MDDVKAIVYMMFEENFLDDEKIGGLKISIPACLLEQDFRERMQRVMFVRRRITAWKWRHFFDTCFKQMLSSHEMYLTFVMYACFREDEYHSNKFESFLSVCSLVKFLCEETLEKTGVNFCDLNSHIFGVFYRIQIQGIFCKRGGFLRLVQYIFDHRFLKWKGNMDFAEKRDKELKREGVIANEVNPNKVAMDWFSKKMASTVLKIESLKLPVLPSKKDLIESVLAYKQKKLAEFVGNMSSEAVEKLGAAGVDVHGCSSANSHSKTDHVAKHQDSTERHEHIIQAVIRHNNSKSSYNKNTNSQIQKGASVLENLRDKIKSLIEVLDECDKE